MLIFASLAVIGILLIPLASAETIPVEAKVYVTQTVSLKLSSCSSCYIKAYLLPKTVKFKQNVLNNNIQILEGNCSYKILLDNFSNSYILFKCENTSSLVFRISSEILRFYNLNPTTDVKCYKNLNYYTGPSLYYLPEYQMALNKISPGYCLKNLYYYLRYVITNFQYSLNLSNKTLSPPEVLYSMQGNCDEIAWLIAEIARNYQIPAKYVLGIWLQGTGSLYHAWNEIWIRNGWYDIDLLAQEYGFVDPEHIYLAEFYSPMNPIQVINASITWEDYNIFYTLQNVKHRNYLNLSLNAFVKHHQLLILGNIDYLGYLPDKFEIILLLDNSSIYTRDLILNPEIPFRFNVTLPLEYLSYGNHKIKLLVIEQLFHKIYSKSYTLSIYPEPKVIIDKAFYKSIGDKIILNLYLKNVGKGDAKDIEVLLALGNYSGFRCITCSNKFTLLRSNQTVESSFKVLSELPLLPKEMLWPVALQYSSLNNETYLYTLNIMIVYLENPKEKLMYLVLGLVLFSVILWLMSKVKYSF
jgi:hypothetical protein